MREFSLRVIALGLCCAAHLCAAEQPNGASIASELEAGLKKLRVPSGFSVELLASEPAIQNPVSFTFDEKGNAYVVETHRRRTSVYDIRNHPDWLNDNFSFRTVADRSNFFRKVLVPGNTNLPQKIVQDRNKDGKFDWHDLEVESERIRLLTDTNGDRVLDRATTFADGFNTLVSGAAAGVLARDGDVYFTCIPDLWKLRDENNDHIADHRERLATGFGVHISFGGHDLHGLRFGPDGKLYFSIADRGLDVVTGEGKRLSNPHSGAVLRCDPDGSNLELVATGFRNPQELAFDQHGNLWTGENNGDGGDKARWLYVVEGGDYGWHIGWQHLPGMGLWNYERLWDLPPNNTSSYLIPPVAHIGHGPAGLAFNPGTGLPPEYRNRFFMCDFPGGIQSFGVINKGAGFEVRDVKQFLWDLWPVDVDFGPDGGLYVLDWVQGWEKPGKGRLYRVFDPSLQDPLVQQTRELLVNGFENRKPEELGALLTHADMRVRMEAQFALAKRGLESTNVFLPVALNSPHDLARLHAIWGIGQIARTHPTLYPELFPLFDDTSNSEVRAQAAKVLADSGYALAFPYLARAASDPSLRVRYFGLLGLGKMGSPEALDSIVENLRTHGETDPYIRHAAVMALVSLNDIDVLEAVARDGSASVRMGALLAMRRLGRPDLAKFLYDPSQQIVLEATRAIYDLPIPDAFSQLAGLIRKSELPRAAMRRVLHANYRLGNLENALALTEFASKTNFIPELRAEALDLLAQWGTPSPRDLLVGLWRPLPQREPRGASLTLRSEMPGLLKSPQQEIRVAAIRAAVRLGIDSTGPELFSIFTNTSGQAAIRLEAMRALAAFKDSKLGEVARLAMEDPEPSIRKEGGTLQVKLKPGEASAAVLEMLENGTMEEKQSAIEVLATMHNVSVDPVLMMWLDKLTSEKAPPELHLEILEAAAKRQDPLIQSHLKKYAERRSGQDILTQYSECLAGGNAEAGRKIFFEKTEVQCLRCHKLNGTGGEVGPDLTGVGSRLSRELLLESIVAPNARFSAGYENLVIGMLNGESYLGVLKGEDAENIIINSPEDGLLKIPKAEITKLDPGLSSMPPELAGMLSRHELRSLIEFLATCK